MNKIIKLGLVLLAIAATYWGLQHIGTPPPPPDSDNGGKQTFQVLGDKIKEEWDSTLVWNKDLFEQHIDELEKKHLSGNLTNKQHQNLLTNVCTYAINTTLAALQSEWKSSSCNPDKIKANYAGVVEISKYPEFTSDYRVVQLKDMKKEYDRILSLIRLLNSNTLGATPEVKENATWDNFSSTTNSIENRIDNSKKSEYYADYFSKITEVNNAFSSYKDRFSPAADSYYISIKGQLKRLFREQYDKYASDTDDNLVKALKTQMVTAQSRLSKEWRNFPGNAYDQNHSDLDKQIFEIMEKIDGEAPAFGL